MSDQLIKRFEVVAGLTLEFTDCSNRYFGDYHRILVEIDALVDSEGATLRLRYQRPLRRMAVCSSDARRDTELLIEQFLTTTVPYMRKSGFAQKLLKSLERPGQRLWNLTG